LQWPSNRRRVNAILILLRHRAASVAVPGKMHATATFASTTSLFTLWSTASRDWSPGLYVKLIPPASICLKFIKFLQQRADQQHAAGNYRMGNDCILDAGERT
jgi:hypothetical protein